MGRGIVQGYNPRKGPHSQNNRTREVCLGCGGSPGPVRAKLWPLPLQCHSAVVLRLCLCLCVYIRMGFYYIHRSVWSLLCYHDHVSLPQLQLTHPHTHTRPLLLSTSGSCWLLTFIFHFLYIQQNGNSCGWWWSFIAFSFSFELFCARIYSGASPHTPLGLFLSFFFFFLGGFLLLFQFHFWTRKRFERDLVVPSMPCKVHVPDRSNCVFNWSHSSIWLLWTLW